MCKSYYKEKVRCIRCKKVAKKESLTNLYVLKYENFCKLKCALEYANKQVNDRLGGVEYYMPPNKTNSGKGIWLLRTKEIK